MLEGKLPCVKHQAIGQRGVSTRFAVDRIADQRRALVVEVHADLVGAAGVQVAEHEGCAGGGISAEDFVIGDRRLAARWVDHRHFLAVHRVAADVGEDRVFRGCGHALGDGEIDFFHRAALGKLRDQRLVRGIGFCDNETTGGVLVEAVDDARALDSADAGKFPAAVVEQGIDQSAIGVSRRGMHDHARFLVEHEQVIVFVKDVEWDVLRRGIERHGFG